MKTKYFESYDVKFAYCIVKRYLKIYDNDHVYVEIDNDKGHLQFWKSEFERVLNTPMATNFYDLEGDNEDVKFAIQIITEMLETKEVA